MIIIKLPVPREKRRDFAVTLNIILVVGEGGNYNILLGHMSPMP
jgi:hypothetical protein